MRLLAEADRARILALLPDRLAVGVEAVTEGAVAEVVVGPHRAARVAWHAVGEVDRLRRAGRVVVVLLPCLQRAALGVGVLEVLDAAVLKDRAEPVAQRLRAVVDAEARVLKAGG